jgi:hypothetical protein
MDASEQIDQKIAGLDDWRGPMMAALRELIHEAAPEIAEEWKWNTAVWTHNGLVCAVGAFKTHLKLNFFDGAALGDPDGLFNSGLDAKKTRAVDFQEGDELDANAIKRLIAAAVEHNG